MPDFASGSRYEPRRDWLWRPGGTYSHGMGVSAASYTLVTLAASTHGQSVRVDYASINLQFDGTDDAAWGELYLELNDSTNVPFLSVSAHATAGYGDVLVPIEAKCEQLSLPFYISTPAHIGMRGNFTLLGTSTIAGTVGISVSHEPYV